ncbi:hypothetical protein Slala03_68440 [Streptomyces lavendulae subsp. lavendulae]|uniref:nuclear transport factor 2 family protein n=1 Tax=Streptomyces lavendulae TaxID=1914 RepID=UPI0024A09E98|nr:nuclear transport factor 2 family protein [Streptomyces lavendulae]GLV87155.1 hypothetical protein Slala03_68440 [Streptomyces lavendulae subsp. lavendulae]GLX40638.1 hypothetical protein Sros01_67110 [Streptomyces roseochromogenus]
MSTESPTQPPAGADYVSAELYTRIQQFYADQMALMDHGDAEAWAATFTEDAVFPAGVTSRAGRADSARAHAEKLVLEKADLRHWLGMLDVRPQPDGTLRTRAYVLTARTVRGEELRITASVVCRDHLVEEGGRWKVVERTLRRDGTV